MICTSTAPNSLQRFRTLECELSTLHKNYYTYHNAIFFAMRDKFLVTCPVHGDFAITPAKHRQGQGCAKCNNTRRALDRRSTTEEFVIKASAVAPQFTYANVVYTSSAVKILVTCPLHGDFSISPNKLLCGRGCPACKSTKISKALTRPVDVFIEAINTKYNSLYSVNASTYTSCKKPVQLVCKVHGTFTATPDALLNKADTGCPTCIKKRQCVLRSATTEQFIAKATKVHNSYYSYADVSYTNNHTPVWITCPIHGNFLQLPSNHLAKKGCLICNLTWRYSNVPTTLYYLKITNPAGITAYKIGITTRALKLRYYKELALGYSFKVLRVYEFLSGEAAFTYEQRALRQFQHLRYTALDKFLHRGAGDTELFYSDILKS